MYFVSVRFLATEYVLYIPLINSYKVFTLFRDLSRNKFAIPVRKVIINNVFYDIVTFHYLSS